MQVPGDHASPRRRYMAENPLAGVRLRHTRERDPILIR
jgi:hypothetical protein